MGVLTTRGNITGLLQNDIVHASEGLSRVILIDKDADIEVGDIFVTSGGPIYPAGRIIGEVVEVYDDPNGMTKHALVKPSEDIFRLNNVFVITGFEGREVIIIDEHE
jgi:rod shape-determining protein MreC